MPAAGAASGLPRGNDTPPPVHRLPLAIALLLIAACGDDAGTTTTEPPPSATTPIAAVTTTVAPQPTPRPLDEIELEVELIVGEFGTFPVFLTGRGHGDDRLFVAEKAGRIWSIDHDGGDRALVLDIRPRVVWSGYEQGLLGMAFHPVDSTRLFIFYTEIEEGGSVIEEHHLAIDADTTDPVPVRTVLTLWQPGVIHQSGMLAFGPDGYLYVTLGDGGDYEFRPDGYFPSVDGRGGDAHHAQDPHSLYGTLIRLDVDRGESYAIPGDNPFADGVEGAREVWALGLRNPWRFSFDGDRIWIADVGQDGWEEVNVLHPGMVAPNFGWPIFEGRHCFQGPDSLCESTDFVAPIFELDHARGACAIVGGYVYRAAAYPELEGTYIFADRCSRELMGIRLEDGEVAEFKVFQAEAPRLTSFGVDGDGELYITADDGVYRISVSR